MQMALLVVALFAGQVAASAAPTGEGSANERCAVWDRETSFAESVKVHDAAAFAAHLHPDAVRGRRRHGEIRPGGREGERYRCGGGGARLDEELVAAGRPEQDEQSGSPE